MKNQWKYLWYVSSILLFVLVVILSFLLFTLKNNRTLQGPNIVSRGERKESLDDREKKGTLEYFISDVLPQYPRFRAQISPELIRRVFPLTLKEIGEKRGNGWLVEVEKESKVVSHYLLTPILEKELIDSMDCVSQNEEPSAELEMVQTVGNEPGLGRDLREKSGYLILSGTTKEGCFGGASYGFVSVYKMRTGEKVKLKGDFTIPSVWSGVSKTGNAFGILRGIYGVYQPTIVVEYGSFKFAAEKVEEVSIVAYFDLQTGELKRLVKFE